MKTKPKAADVPPVFYQAEDGAITLRLDLRSETMWATMAQISALFGRDKSVVSRHIKSIFSSGELDRAAVVAKNATTAADGKTYLVESFNLDVVISVGYRINSASATRFRRWATEVLKSYVLAGYAVDAHRLADSAARLAQLRGDIEAIAQTGSAARTLDEARGLLNLVTRYSRTWSALEGYDREVAPTALDVAPSPRLDPTALLAELAELRAELIARGEASDLFARERSPGSYAASVLAAFQAFGGEDLYPGAARKAAELLYLVAKDHPFVDGNKRAAAFTLAHFCAVAGLPAPDPVALAALALFVAESDPARKSRVVGVVSSLLSAA